MNNYACSECGNEQDSMYRPCDKCGSYRVVLVSFIEQHFGKNWRDNFTKEENENGRQDS
jgi:hypothetical protein